MNDQSGEGLPAGQAVVGGWNLGAACAHSGGPNPRPQAPKWGRWTLAPRPQCVRVRGLAHQVQGRVMEELGFWGTTFLLRGPGQAGPTGLVA